jgi:hypothetical protein
MGAVEGLFLYLKIRLGNVFSHFLGPGKPRQATLGTEKA